MRRSLLALVFSVLLALPALAAQEGGAAPGDAAPPEGASDGAVYLKPLEITEAKDTTQRITQTDMERINAVNLWEAMTLAPGVEMSQVGMRNDSRFSIRGYNQSQIRVMLDDIPVYIPYDRQEDFARYVVDDLESIEISKGYSSVLQGAGALGGVVNLRSARPQKEFEFKARYRNYFDNHGNDMARQAMASMGTKQDLFFLKATGSFIEQDHYRLPDNFSTSNKINAANLNGGKRDHSDYRDKKLNLMAGLTPTEDSEIVIGYIAQRSAKDQPPYAGKLRASQTGRQWEWPFWDKDSYYISTKFSPTNDWYVKANAYYDEYTNKLRGWRDWDRTNHNFDTVYDDNAYGGRIETGYTFNDMHKLAASFSYRRDEHKRRDWSPRSPWHKTKHIKDDTYEAGLEYTLTPDKHWTFVVGASYINLDPVKTWDEDDQLGIMGTGNGHDAFDGQVAIFYNFNDNHQVYTTAAHKTRMPSMKERYSVTSYLSDSGNDAVENLPNPGLKPEKAWHLEVGYRGTIQNKIQLGASLFWSEVKDLIERAWIYDTLRGDPDNDFWIQKNDNIGKVNFAGLELSLLVTPADWLTLGGTFSYIDWNIRDSSPYQDSGTDQELEYLTSLPRTKANAYAVITPIEGLSLIPRMEYIAESYFASSRRDARNNQKPTTDEFALMHFKATYDITENFTIEAGVDNVFDTTYAWDEGYYMPGRTFYAGLSVNF